MKYDEIVAAWDAQKVRFHTWETLPDRERIEFALSLAGKVEKQEPVAYLFRDMNSGGRNGCLKVCHITPCDGAFPVYTAPQPCPECDEKQSAIDVWEGRYADKAAECEKLKADLAEHAAFREICVENANVQANEAMRYQKRISTLTKERDELAAQVEKMRIALAEILNWNKDLDRPVLDAYVKSILAIHDLSTGILNRMRAETLTKKGSRKMKVFMGGTCNESDWRNRIIPMLEVGFFNPVVDDWTPDCMAEELRQREECDVCLYVITPKMTGVYSVAEVIDDSNKRPARTVFVRLRDDGDEKFTDGQWKSLGAVAQMVERNGGTAFDSLKSAALHINAVTPNAEIRGGEAVPLD